MSDTVNPYQTPGETVQPVNLPSAQGALTETMLIHLKSASPWLKFIGVLGFIGSGLTALWGLSFSAFIPLVAQVWDEIPQAYQPFGAFIGAALGGSMALVCVGAGLLMFFPSLFAFRFGSKIQNYLRTGTDQDLELAFKNNKSFWKFIGILCIVQLALFPLIIIGSIIAAVALALF